MPDKQAFEFLLPLYGDPDLCRVSIDSVLRQTYQDFILTIADDSLPNFALAEYVQSLGDPRISYHQNESALGAGGNFRRVLARSSAEWVTFMGSDDVLHPHYLERMTHLLAQAPGADIIQPGVRVIDGAGSPVVGTTDRVKRLIAPTRGSSPTMRGGEPLASSLLSGNWTYFPSLLWRRECIVAIGFRDYDIVQDLGLLLDVVMRGGTLLVDDEVTFDYRRHGRSLSTLQAHSGARFDEERTYLNGVAAELDALGWSRAARRARLRLFSRLHAALLTPRAALAADRSNARHLLRHALGR